MFRHLGKTRTLAHNLRIASLLSFVAGMVNVVGFLKVQRLTTNVTGHFAYFVDEMFKLNFWNGLVYFLYIFFFFAGSFISSLLIEIMSKKNERLIYVVPASIEALILLLVALYGQSIADSHPGSIACSLLFAMGLQNSLVTRISNATVRTTHLTGLFTDLGIEFSQLFFYRTKEQRNQLLSSIRLRLTIISFFFIGGTFGGICYSGLELHTLIFGAAALVAGLMYDGMKFNIIRLRRKLKH
ncbi:MAG: YoaK family protein [Ferruginibacter sp.]